MTPNALNWVAKITRDWKKHSPAFSHVKTFCKEIQKQTSVELGYQPNFCTWGFPLNFERFGNSSGGVELSLYEILSVCGRIGKIAQRTDTDPQNPSRNVIL